MHCYSAILAKQRQKVHFFRILFGYSEYSRYFCRKTVMHVISFATIRSYSQQHADASVALRDWHTKTEKASWKTLADIKKTFGSADYVGNDRYVFNIKGNDYRLVAMIFLQAGQVYIRWIGTHAEYDKIKDIENF